jgi:hypothetical protein
VQDFNKDRHNRKKGLSSVGSATPIIYEMRAMAPLLYGQLDIASWLNSPNLGKQLAAIKYLDWAKDIEFAEALASRLEILEKSGDTFQAYHVLLALHSMADQLSYNYKDKVMVLLDNYKPEGRDLSSRLMEKERILKILQ